MLQTFTVEELTLVLLKNLQQVNLLQDLRLVGGTALALQLGHRNSVDLDFFGKFSFTGLEIDKELQAAGFDVELKYDKSSIKTLFVNDVKVDMVNYPYGWLEEAVETEGVKMAGLKDIAAMKLSAITNRGRKKDFIDLYFLLQQFSLKQMMEFYLTKYPSATTFNVIRSLNYFKDAEEDAMPTMFMPVSWEKIKSTIQTEVQNY